MLFNSPIFLFVFLPATVAAYIVVRQVAGPRAVLALLLVASIFFYGWWNPIYVPLLLGLAVFNFVVARGITAYREAGRADRVSLLLTFGIVVDLMVLGDHFGPLVSPAYDAVAAGQPLDFFLAWQAAVSFKLQLYFDFSGYSEMALGAARLFGIQLPLNFNSPYRALNVVDFWRRWHMTLTRFLRDYVYIPLGGSRRGTPKLYRNLMITLALSGLWHGAAWHFVVWGSLQGASMVVAHAWRSVWR